MPSDTGTHPHWRHWRRILFALCFLCILVTTLTASATPGDGHIKVRAEATVQGTGLAARDKAIRIAQRQIIAKILEGALAARHVSAAGLILDNAPKYIRSTQVLRQETQENATTLEIESSVNRDQVLRETAEALLPRLAATPSVLLILVEQSGSKPGPAERALANALRAEGLSVVDPAEVRERYTEAELLEKTEADLDMAGGFAQEHLVDVVILGKAVTEVGPDERSSNVLACTGKVTLRVFRADDGSFVDEIAQEARVHGVDASEGSACAIQDACEKLSRDAFLFAMLAVLGASPSDTVMITIQDPGSHSRVAALTKALTGVAGAGEIEELFYADKLARLRVKYVGPMGALVEAIAASRYDGMSAEVTHVVQRRMKLRFEP